MPLVHCVFCEKQIPKKEATIVPRNPETKKKWEDSLGQVFRRNCRKYLCPYICKSHFAGKKRTKNCIPDPGVIPGPPPENLEHWVWNVACNDKFTQTDDLSEIPDAESISHESLSNAASEIGMEGFDDDLSEYIPSATVDVDDDVDMDEEVPLETTEKPQSFRYFISSKNQILSLLKRCHECGKTATKANVSYIGVGVTIEITCHPCQRSWCWKNAEKIQSERNKGYKKLTTLALDLTGSILLTGNCFENVKAIFETMEAPFFTAQSYDSNKRKYIYPAIRKTHAGVMVSTKDKLATRIQKEGPLNLIGDGSYDSRGRSALRCKYVLLDAKSKLVVDYVIIRRGAQERNYDMEKTGFLYVFPRFIEKMTELSGSSPVATFTSDRNKSISTAMCLSFPQVEHFYDHWHYIRNIVLELLKKQTQQQFAPVRDWLRSFTNHVYYSIASSDGDGEKAKEKLLSFFNHVLNKHDSFQELAWYDFKIVSCCEHGEIDEFDENSPAFLNTSDKKDVKSLRALFSVINKGTRLEDIKRVSPHFATSSVESYNASSLRYTSKDFFYSDEGYEIRTMLSVIDWNTKQCDEMEGRRKVIAEKKYFNKTAKKWSLKRVKTRADYQWRKLILDKARKLREEENIVLATEHTIGDDVVEPLSDEETVEEEENDALDPDDLWIQDYCSDNEMEAEQSDEEPNDIC